MCCPFRIPASIPPWDTDADGLGQSLQRLCTDFRSNSSDYWVGGTPTPRAANVQTQCPPSAHAVPDIAIRSTAIVGFPGETDEEFEELCGFAEELQLERLGVFTYSPQEGTKAADMDDDVPEDEKNRRLEELTELQRTITEGRLGRFVGREADVLVDEVLRPDDAFGTHSGRVMWQADDVDGVTYVDNGGWAKPGDLLKTRIISNEDYDFRAVGMG